MDYCNPKKTKILAVLTVVSFVAFCVFTGIYEWTASEPTIWKCIPFLLPSLCLLVLMIHSRYRSVIGKAMWGVAVLLGMEKSLRDPSSPRSTKTAALQPSERGRQMRR